MKKFILAIACISLGISATFANPAADSKKDKKECDKKECQAPGRNPFEGLNLTDAQQKQLSEICPFGPGKEKKEGEKTQAPDRKRKFSREQADSMRRAMVEKRLDARKTYLAKVKEILTPEQYVQFLENNFVNAMPQTPDPKNGMKPGQRPDRNGKQGQRKNQRPGAPRN